MMISIIKKMLAGVFAAMAICLIFALPAFAESPSDPQQEQNIVAENPSIENSENENLEDENSENENSEDQDI